MAIFGKSWQFETPIPNNLRENALVDLDVADLLQLQFLISSLIYKMWTCKANVIKGDEHGKLANF